MNYWRSSDHSTPFPEYYAPLLARKGADRAFTKNVAQCGLYRNTTICEATNQRERVARARSLHEAKRKQVQKKLRTSITRIKTVQARIHRTQNEKAILAVCTWAACRIQYAYQRKKKIDIYRRKRQLLACRILQKWFRFCINRIRFIYAATQIQTFYRIWRGRLLVAEKTRISNAAIKVQSLMRRILCQNHRARYKQIAVAVCIVVRESILFGAARAFFTVNIKNDAASMIQRTLLHAWKRKKVMGKRSRLVLHNRRRAAAVDIRAKTGNGEAAKALAERRRAAVAVHHARRALLRCVTGARIIYSLGKAKPWGRRFHMSAVNKRNDMGLSTLPELAMLRDDDPHRARKKHAVLQKNHAPLISSNGSRQLSHHSHGNVPSRPNELISSAHIRRPQVGNRVLNIPANVVAVE